MVTPEGQPIGPEHTAAYIADLTRELQVMARRSGLHFIAYLLGLVQQEAESAAGAPSPAPEE